MGERLLVGFFWKSGNVSKNFCLSVRVSQIFSAIDNVDDEQRETKTLSLSLASHTPVHVVFLSLARAECRRIPDCLSLSRSKKIKI